MVLCNTSGINRMVLLMELWHAACLSHGIDHLKWDYQQARKDLQPNGYAERICGISMKVQVFDGPFVDTKNYNRMHGESRFERVVIDARIAASRKS